VDRGKTAREWLDVLAKAAIAAAGVFVAILANNYQQKASVVTLLSQRETAESDLRSSMMDHLVGPFVGSVQEKKPLDPDEERVLLEILALNFHAHFELKPLFLKVDGDLRQHRRDAGRTALQAVARRVVDRQIGMLQAAGLSDSRSFLGQLFSAPPAAASQADLFFERTQRLTEPDTVLQVSADRNAAGDDVNTPTRPARFGGGGGQAVCSTSPDGRFALRVRVTSYDSALRMAAVSWDSSRDVNACARGQGAAWQPGRSFSLSPYDFPLTDNTQLDPKDRFALNLYYITDDDPQSTTLQLKLVWFPEGYITERERPMNAYEVKRTLGLQ
jgi:hypothetical protein